MALLACGIETLSLQDFIFNIRENLENKNKDQEGASPKVLSRGSLCEEWIYFAVWESKLGAEEEIVHTEVTGDTGQWTSSHQQADQLDIINRWAGTNAYIFWVRLSAEGSPAGPHSFSFPLLQDGGIGFSWIEDFRGL